MVVMQFPKVLHSREVSQLDDYIATLPHVDKKRLKIAKPTAHM